MHLVAKRETYEDQGHVKEYTSARLNSKFAFTYGRVEVRAKMPQGVGTWPAIWMLSKNISEAGAYWQLQGYGTTSWPHCGEIDLLEHWGKNQDFVQSAVHTTASFGDQVTNLGGKKIANASTEFHLYALEWSAEKIMFEVDGEALYTYEPAVRDSTTWPFDSDQYILMNIAIEKDIDPAFEESAMVVDYIRVYQ
ncbi:MAG: glycoside hydrolase family 16 protein [Bacteroidota bacterium]